MEQQDKGSKAYLISIVMVAVLGGLLFDYVWESGSDTGFRVEDPAPPKEFAASVTSGVRDRAVSGNPFATVDAPWDWCSGIRAEVVESAKMYVCRDVSSVGNVVNISSSSGWISDETLESLVQILNKIPKSAFVPDAAPQTVYWGFRFSQDAPSSVVSVIDGVNNIAVAIQYLDGKVTMLLTDEMEKVREDSRELLEPTQLWTVEAQALADFTDVYFTCASSVDRLLQNARGATRCHAIGPSTSAALRRRGIAAVLEASEPTLEALADT